MRTSEQEHIKILILLLKFKHLWNHYTTFMWQTFECH